MSMPTSGNEKASIVSRVLGPTRLRQILSDPDNIVSAPGVYDGITARMAINEGFEAVYMTGAGTAMSRLGMADLGLTTFHDMISNAETITQIDPEVAVIADADTGYGGPIMVDRVVKAYARAGVAAIHIEDQVQEKRCGQLLGKQLVTAEQWYAKIRAAVSARDSICSDMLIIARTDANAGEGFDESIQRMRGARDAGADVLFLEALKTQDECRRACQILRGTPMLLNMVPAGITPNLTVEQAKEIGFKIVIWPGACIEPVIRATSQSLRALKNNGRPPKEDMEDAAGPKKWFQMCGLDRSIEIEQKAGGNSFSTY